MKNMAPFLTEDTAAPTCVAALLLLPTSVSVATVLILCNVSGLIPTSQLGIYPPSFAAQGPHLVAGAGEGLSLWALSGGPRWARGGQQGAGAGPGLLPA